MNITKKCHHFVNQGKSPFRSEIELSLSLILYPPKIHRDL